VLPDGHVHGLITQNRPYNKIFDMENWRLSTGHKEAVEGLFLLKTGNRKFFYIPFEESFFFSMGSVV
jgi:hypothetical protein